MPEVIVRELNWIDKHAYLTDRSNRLALAKDTLKAFFSRYDKHERIPFT